MDSIEIEIINWAKHQPRKDIKHPKWFAVDNRILEDSKLFSLTDSEWKALFYIFCQASQQNSAKVVLTFAHAKRVCDISKNSIESLIRKLPFVIRTDLYAPRTQSERDTTIQDNTEQNITNNVCTVVETTPMPTEVRSAKDLVLILSEDVIGLYSESPGYVTRESVKAWAWCENNRRKAPKVIRGYRTFFSGWLERGWEKHRRSLPSVASAPALELSPEERAIFEKAEGA